VTDPVRIAWAVATRWRALDPLLPAPWTATTEDVTLHAGASVGYAQRLTLSPDDPRLLWGTADRFRLRPLVAGPDLAASLDGLLSAWRDWLAALPDPPGADSSASLDWPSRDTRGLPALRRHGLAPYTVIAARRVGTPGPTPPPAPPGATHVRRATPADVDVVAGLELALMRYEADLGTAHLRDRAGEWLLAGTANVLARRRPWVWLAEQAGAAVGLVVVQPPEAAGWLEPYTRARPLAYLSSLFVDPAARGAGVGAALVAAAHQEMVDAGVGVALLHYSQVSPVSGPFWHRLGYRPLWTSWQARPASQLG
jgi:GNAT superfamily N-acetyltransferase